MTGIIKQDNFTPWICAFLLLVISFPQWVWGMGANIRTIISYLLLFIAYKDISRNKSGISAGFVALSFQLLILLLVNGLNNFNSFLLTLYQAIGFASIFFCSVDFWKRCLDCFIKLLAVLLVFALIEHIMINFMGVKTAVPVYAECPTNPDRDYYVYHFNVYLVNYFSLFNRFHAFYDEPGVLGNILMVLLYIQKFDFKKWYNIIFLISGILSFSLVFYFAVAAYYILFGGTRNKIMFAIALIGATYYFYNNEFVYDYVFGRLEFEDGKMVGYNREMNDFGNWIESKKWTDFLLWGYQPREAVPYAASWKWAFALFGIIPSLIYLFTITYPHAKNIMNKSDILRGLILMVLIWIQRPFIHQYLYVFLLVIPFIYSSTNNIGSLVSTKNR